MFKMHLAKLPVPELEFAGSAYFHNPRRGLLDAGPFDMRFGSAHHTQVRLALVGPKEVVENGHAWFVRCQSPIDRVDPDSNVEPFPGFHRVYRSELVVETRATVFLDEEKLAKALALKPYEALVDVIRLYADAMLTAKREFRPDVVICCIPEAVEKRCWNVQRVMTDLERKQAKAVAAKTAQSQLELPLDWQPDEDPEDLLRRDFRRALKAEAMRIDMPIQVARNNLFLDLKGNEEAAIRAWNSTVGLYYKAGGIPWRIRGRGPETCYVGITFHHLRTNKRSLIYSSLAQAFTTNGGGFALKGSAIEPEHGDRNRTPHMNAEQAEQLGNKVLAEYRIRNGMLPKRIVLHKSSRFWDEEQRGFRRAFKDVPVVRLVALAPSSIRLVTHASYPPARGTLMTVEDTRHFLFTSGYVKELETYPGPHIPIPVELILHGEHTQSDVREAAIDALGLGRLNWNTSDLRSSQPVTLGFARRVGGIMAEYGLSTDHEPDPSYRYYM